MSNGSDWFPGCGGCCEGAQPDCILYADNFNDGVIDPEWILGTGVWSESGGTLNTVSSNARIQHNNQGEILRRQRVRVWGQQVGDVARVFSRYISDSSHIWGEIVFGEPGTLGQLWLSDRADPTVVNPPDYIYTDLANRNQWLTAELCTGIEDPRQINFATFSLLDSEDNLLCYVRRVLTRINSGGFPGLGTGSPVTGTVFFDDYLDERYRDAGQYAHCPTCAEQLFCRFGLVQPGRGYFINGITPPNWRINISGVTTGAGFCPSGECGQLDGDYVAPMNPDCRPSVVVNHSPPLCETGDGNIEQHRVTLFWDPVPNPDSLRMSVVLDEWDDIESRWEDIALWQHVYPNGVKGYDIQDQLMTLADSNPRGCDASGATVRVWAL